MTVRELRKQLGWSQERLASHMGCSWKTISRYEHGYPVSVKSLAKLSAIARATGIEGFAPNCPCCGRPL